MVGSSIKLVSQLTRLDTCAIVFLCLAIPLFYATGDLYVSVLRSLPVLTICMCGFVINDLHDIEKDRTNHPTRPLASDKLSPFFGSIVYFVLLAVSLILVKALVDLSHVYLYLLLLVGLINYNYIVLYTPALKNIYVAIVGIIPLLILASLLPQERPYGPVIGALFLLLLAREILMDVEDAAGDGDTFSKMVGLHRAQQIAFCIKLAGNVLLSAQVRDGLAGVLVAVMLVSDLLGVYLWREKPRRGIVLLAMKMQLLLGIYFLL